MPLSLWVPRPSENPLVGDRLVNLRWWLLAGEVATIFAVPPMRVSACV